MVEILWPEFVLFLRTFLLFLEITFPLVCYWYDGNGVIRHESKRWAEVSLCKPSGGLVMFSGFTSNYQNKGYWLVLYIMNINLYNYLIVNQLIPIFLFALNYPSVLFSVLIYYISL